MNNVYVVTPEEAEQSLERNKKAYAMCEEIKAQCLTKQFSPQQVLLTAEYLMADMIACMEMVNGDETWSVIAQFMPYLVERFKGQIQDGTHEIYGATHSPI